MHTSFKKENRKCVCFHRNLERTIQKEDDVVREGKKLTDFKLLLSLSKSSDTTSKSEDTEIRSGTPVVVALGMVTSIAASPARWRGEPQQHKQQTTLRRRAAESRATRHEPRDAHLAGWVRPPSKHLARAASAPAPGRAWSPAGASSRRAGKRSRRPGAAAW
jgi:hypothetical protein